ncbi:exo-alpha-sialidase [Microbacterium keratanolyticum]|uniref:exo-alpha-sialidase n=1 Tax=Microbacterium keratanolyticum TaxID=67574 RepID=UPI00366BE404
MRSPLFRRRLALAAATVTACLTLSTFGASAALAATPSEGEFTTTNIGADRTSANFFYRIPALAHLGDGVVLASWDGRPGSAADAPNPNSIVQRRSTDNGQTWGPIETIAAGHLGTASVPKYGYSDPSYIVDRETGRVFSFFVYSKDQGFHGSIHGNDDADRRVISSAVMHSDDGGVTWSEPRLITSVSKPANGTTSGGTYTPVAGDVRTTFATSGEGIQLQYGEYAGRLIQQFAGWVVQADGSSLLQAYSVYSDDHGETWHKGENVGAGMDENKVVELSDGTVMLNSRDSDNGRLRKVALSTDGGHSYSAVTRDDELPDPTNNASLIRLHPDAAAGTPEARKLLFTNSNNGANGNRVNGAARVSCDDGQTWPGLASIDRGSFAYSSATMLDDGRIGVLWERNYTNDMQFSTFDEKWLNYVCAPLSVTETPLAAGETRAIDVTVANQEAVALSGAVTIAVPSGWSATTAQIADLAPGASATVSVDVTVPASATGVHRPQATFTAADGRVSQTTTTLRLPVASVMDLTLAATNTSPTRDVVANPYTAGEVLSFNLRVTSRADVATVVTPHETTFTSGFLPTACRWQNLGALGAYDCKTPKRTLTAEDIERGWYTPEFSFTIAPMSDTSNTTVVRHVGAPVVLRDGVLDATITGARTDTGRDLAASPYAVGEKVPYAFRVDSASPVTTDVTPTAGSFSPFLPAGAGNCRYRGLPAFGGFDCATPRHAVTDADLADGFFLADTTWTVSAAGQSSATIEVAGGEVDVIARAPQLTAGETGVWNDTNGNGVANVGDTVAWTTTVTNTGNVRLTGVTAPGIEGAELAVGESATGATRVSVLDAAALAAGHVSAAAVEATAQNGSRAAEIVATADPLPLTLAPAWTASAAYVTGELTTHDGQLWVASWWTRNQTPGSSPQGPWQQIATDADGTALWAASRIFVTGDEVTHDGQSYVAKWWTRNQVPGDKNGPWRLLP